VISAVVLAAGAATRFGSPKQLLLLPYVLERLEGTPIDEIVVVSGAYAIEESDSLELGAARVVPCPDWALGPGASLRCGLAALAENVDAALVVLADGPYLDRRAIERVLAHRDQADVVAASYEGVRSHPAVLARAAWANVPDDGGRGLDALLIPCDDLTPPGDIDTVADAREWRS
jgi:CTP:molybdopterin cytidylyltransferase MocA